MINRKLIISNIIITTLCLLITLGIVFKMTLNLYRDESVVIYTQIFDDNYNQLNSTLNKTKDNSLSIAVNKDMVEMFSKDVLPSGSEYEKIRKDLIGYYEIENLDIYAIKDNERVYSYSSSLDVWSVVDLNTDSYDNYGHNTIFTFRLANSDNIKVSRLMFDKDDNNKPIGVVNVYVSRSEIFSLFYSYNPFGDYNSKLYLADENAEILLPYNSKEVIDSENVQEFNAAIIKSTLSFGDGKIIMGKQLRACNWKLVAVISNASFFEGYKSTLFSIIAIFLIAQILSIILSFVITRRITKPITTLADEVLQSAKNDNYQQFEIPENAQGTIKILYENYNYLIDEVNKSIKNIQEISKKEVENQFLLLQAQINPHFLYNTLNTISWLAQNQQNEDIERMVVSLVNMFRTSLNNGQPLITLEKEIDYVKSYLEIMQYRYPDAYEAEYHMQEDVKDLMVTKQILQPLVENALNHGFLESKVFGKIIINAYKDGQYLILESINNGAKIDLDKVSRILAGDPELKSKHYGIRNVNERLITYYGKESGLNYSYEDNNTIVRIKLPIEKCRG